VVVEY